MEQTAAVASSVHYLSNVITLCSLVDRGSQYTKAPDKAIPSPNHLGDVQRTDPPSGRPPASRRNDCGDRACFEYGSFPVLEISRGMGMPTWFTRNVEIVDLTSALINVTIFAFDTTGKIFAASNKGSKNADCLIFSSRTGLSDLKPTPRLPLSH